MYYRSSILVILSGNAILFSLRFFILIFIEKHFHAPENIYSKFKSLLTIRNFRTKISFFVGSVSRLKKVSETFFEIGMNFEYSAEYIC